ncbi:MAG: YwiC-like family protein [Chloroflexi bacterium]|nr:YwiC-like family protein [Chloroflexota bacterium]
MTAAPAVKLRSVALPAEHGGWGFMLEPILLGLLVAPSLAGLLLGLGVFGMFLARHPLKLVAADRKRGRRFARTGAAERFVLLYGGLAAFGVFGAALVGGPTVLLPMLAAAPLMLLTLYFDFTNRSRDLLPELAGPLGLAAVSSSIALAGGWPLLPALALWVIQAARAQPSVLYVRARLKLEHGKDAHLALPLIAQATALVIVLALALAGLAPLLVVAPLAALLARAWFGLYRRVPLPAKIIGFREMAFGFGTVLLAAVGYALKI